MDCTLDLERSNGRYTITIRGPRWLINDLEKEIYANGSKMVIAGSGWPSDHSQPCQITLTVPHLKVPVSVVEGEG